MRRRLGWVAGFAALAAAVAAAALLLPSRSEQRASGHGVTRQSSAPERVPVTSARRREIDRLLATFVLAAVERRDLPLAYRLTLPSFRAGITRRDWMRGNLPILPFDARDGRFSGWRVHYSHPREVSLDLLLQPSAREKLGALAFTVVVKKTARGWRIAEFSPAASFAPEKKSPRILAQPDFQPNMVEGTQKARLDAKWLLAPAALLALIVLVPLGLIVAHVRRGRRAMREYRASYR